MVAVFYGRLKNHFVEVRWLISILYFTNINICILLKYKCSLWRQFIQNKKVSTLSVETFCDPAGIRTQGHYIKSVMLYQLSYGINTFLEELLPLKAGANIERFWFYKQYPEKKVLYSSIFISVSSLSVLFLLFFPPIIGCLSNGILSSK